MYYPQGQREPGGCMETLVISRVVFGLLLVPFFMVFGAIFAILLTLYALSIHPLLAVACLVGCFSVIGLVARWEQRRAQQQIDMNDFHE